MTGLAIEPVATTRTVRSVRTSLSGWGRYPTAEMDVHRPERIDALLAAVASGSPVLARGLGRSYGDAALNGTGSVILSERLNRFLDFDPYTGVLACEAGVSFEDLLREFVPRGFFPPIVPGTKFVTLGGALACDIHGKDHHGNGSFARHVIDFVLATAEGELLRCSREKNADVFWATLGGMGLTGFIVELRIRMQRVTSAYVSVDYDRAPDLDTALALFHQSDHRYAYSVAWIDCLARGKSLGRGVLMRGNALGADDLAGEPAKRPFAGSPRGHVRLGFDLPHFLLNAHTVRAFNSAYYHRYPIHARDVRQHYESFFFPLDRIGGWNRLYGARGFMQYQFVLPAEGGRDGLARILERVASHSFGSFLAVLKTFGPAEPDAMLSFPIAGYTLALDIAYHPDVLRVLDRLDAEVAEHGGRVYLAKDARLAPEPLRRMYPQLPRWQDVRERVDPAHHFASDLSRRLGLEQ